LVTSDNFAMQLEMELKTKFRGNSSDVFVHGTNQFLIPKYGDEFIWGHLETCAHNVIVGWMWIDHFGTLEVANKATGEKASINFTRCGWLGAGRYELSGDITDKDGVVRMRIKGKWNEFVFAIKVDENGNESAPILLWKKALKNPDNKWGWTKFNDNLNYMSDAYKAVLPPTDSRLRTDRWYLEKDDLEKAGIEKHRLEEKQRAERKEREVKQEEWETKYFKKVDDPQLGHKYVYVGQYWEEREARFKSANYNQDEDKPEEETTSVGDVTKSVEQVTISDEQGKEEIQQ